MIGRAAVMVAAAAVLLLAWPGAVWAARRMQSRRDDLHKALGRLRAGRSLDPDTGDAGPEWEPLFAELRQLESDHRAELNRRSERYQLLERLIDSLVDGVMGVDGRGAVFLANHASRALAGISLAEPWGRPLMEVTRLRPVTLAVEEVLATGEAVEREFQSPLGGRPHLAMRAAPLPREDRTGVLVVLRDLTERRKLEQMRREFIANVSHELKTPISSIRLYAETLRLGALHDPENNVAFLEQIEEHADHLHQLIVDMLHLGRFESSTLGDEMSAVSLGDAVRDSVRLHATEAESRQLELRIEPGSPEVPIRTQPEGLRMILNNLLSNAIKYTPAGGRIVVRWDEVPDAREVQLEVADTGIGIAEEHLERVFERFFRVDKARASHEGTGLGLAIVKHIAQASGGSVAVRSTIGEGSCFTVRFARE